MKKRISMVLISTILLAGCSTVKETEVTSETVTEVTATEATENETEIIDTETTVEITEPEETGYIRTQEQIDAAWEARLAYNGNGLEEIPLMNYKGERYSDAPEYDNIYAELTEIKDNIYYVTRCDNRVVSYEGFSINGNLTGYNYDAYGNKLKLEDVIVNKSLFDYFVTDYICNEWYPNLYDYEKNYATLLEVMDRYEEITDEWYLSADSLVYIINANMHLKISYRQFADFFNPEYLPGEGLMIARVTNGGADLQIGSSTVTISTEIIYGDASYDVESYYSEYNGGVWDRYWVQDIDGHNRVVLFFCGDSTQQRRCVILDNTEEGISLVSEDYFDNTLKPDEFWFID